VETMRS